MSINECLVVDQSKKMPASRNLFHLLMAWAGREMQIGVLMVSISVIVVSGEWTGSKPNFMGDVVVFLILPVTVGRMADGARLA
jgi:hypothetical protein